MPVLVDRQSAILIVMSWTARAGQALTACSEEVPRRELLNGKSTDREHPALQLGNGSADYRGTLAGTQPAQAFTELSRSG